MSDGVKYPSNVLEGFGSGALLDLRVRLAADFLKHSPVYGHIISDGDNSAAKAADLAGFALDLADELLKQADARGWVDPIPEDDGELTPDLRRQAKRTAGYQAQQQLDANQYVQDAQGRVVAQQMPLGRPNGRAN